jgi:microcin C transport system permease protein
MNPLRRLAHRLFDPAAGILPVSPLTRRRWQQFRANRRAWWSFLLLVGLFGLGLSAPLVCRYGPLQVMDSAAFERHRRASLTLSPEVVAGRFNLSGDGRVTRAENCDRFFPGCAAPNGEVFTNHWRVPPALSAALALRFGNQAAPAVALALTQATNPLQQATCVLAAYEPRETPPSSVRLTLRVDTAAERRVFRIHADHRVEPASDWQQLPAETRAVLRDCAARAFDGKEGVTNLVVAGVPSVARVPPANVAWPHRPVPGHWMGIDQNGYDVWTRLLYGLRTSLSFGLLLVVWAMLLGFIIGAVQGYFGGWVDILTQRGIEIWSALPFLYVMILIGDTIGRSFALLLVCYGLFNWIGLSYYMRAEFLRLRHRPFVEAARCQGLGHGRIIFRHLLPNALTPIITLFPFELVGAIGALTALDFLGFGLPPLTPSWGELLQQAQQNRHAWWLALYPSATLFLVMLLAVLIGEGLRDAFDPKVRTRLE